MSPTTETPMLKGTRPSCTEQVRCFLLFCYQLKIYISQVALVPMYDACSLEAGVCPAWLNTCSQCLYSSSGCTRCPYSMRCHIAGNGASVALLLEQSGHKGILRALHKVYRRHHTRSDGCQPYTAVLKQRMDKKGVKCVTMQTAKFWG